MTTMYRPYKNEGLNKIYNLLFCDDPGFCKSENLKDIYPWNILSEEAPDTGRLKEIIADKTIETRAKIFAHHQLLKNGISSTTKEVLAVIIEVGLDNGLDVLAAYKDYTARYINHSEKMLIWETETGRSTELIDSLFENSQKLIPYIGPWDKERKPFPAKDMVRLTFLVSDGLYFGEGPFDLLQRDGMGGPVIYSATQLMIYLTEQQLNQSSVTY